MQIDFLYYPDCPSHEAALERLKSVLAAEKAEAQINIIMVETEDHAARLDFPGSPTIRINGQDVDPVGTDQPIGLTCRVYRTSGGRFSPLPPAELIENAIKDALNGE